MRLALHCKAPMLLMLVLDDPRAMARFKEQPQHCSCMGCGNQRRWGKGQHRLTMQERRAYLFTN